jgi:N-acetylmuramic acid 6-phosphate etherase
MIDAGPPPRQGRGRPGAVRQTRPTDPPLPSRLRSGGRRRLPTEARHPRRAALDRLPTAEVVALLLEEDRRGLDRALRQRRAIAGAAVLLADTLAGGGVVVFAGAGTSGRLGILEAAECPPTFGTDPRRLRAVMAGGRGAVLAAREGAEDRPAEGRRAARGLGRGDLLVGVSASSVTPFTRAALAQARRRGARTLLVTCAPRRGLRALADRVIALDTGPEVLAGSTRLKAGSATKAVLNALTTAAMVRLGKVFEDLMVDLRPGSRKLRDRALRIVAAAGRVSRPRATRLLRQAGGETKTAVVMARLRLPAAAARARLARAGGHLRAALDTA